MDRLRAAYRVSVIIGLAMMASLLVTTIIVGLFDKGSIEIKTAAVAPGGILEIIKFILLGASVVILFLIRIINRVVLAADSERGARLDAAPRPAPVVSPEFGRLTAAAVVTYALCEAPAIFGLVLFFLGRNPSDFHMFLLISLFLFAVNFPKFSQWEEWYRQQGHDQGKERT